MLLNSHANDFKLLGKFLKTHGVEGQLILKLSSFEVNEIENGETVFVEIDGILVPFFIFSFRVLSDDTAIVKFDETYNLNDALLLVNCRVFIKKQSEHEFYSDDSGRLDEIKGFSIVDDKFGPAGILLEVIELPENPLMIIDLNGKEILVPFNENIVSEINYTSRLIKIFAPEGLFDLYL